LIAARRVDQGLRVGAHWVSYRLGGAIPSHSYRWIRVLWRSDHCYLEAAGGSQGNSDFRLRIRFGWITKTEDINLVTMVVIGATKATTRADAASCCHHPLGSP
jgi:hypothetical protein